MINATFTLKIQSIEETFDLQGVKIVGGDCSFLAYSKDGLAENTMPFRAKGAAAVAIAECGCQSAGVAIGYPDLVVVDTGNGYKQKRCTLVIRKFISTTFQTKEQQNQAQATAQPPLPVAATTTDGHTADISDIPF